MVVAETPVATEPGVSVEEREVADTPLCLFLDADAAQEFEGPDVRQRQLRKPHDRSERGGLMMTWRVPGWELPPLPQQLRISSHDDLRELDGRRQQCSTCGKSQHYHCFNCFKAMTPPERTPRVCLPFHFHVVFDRRETPSRSTGVHAAILAPCHVSVHTWQDVARGALPQWDPHEAAVLFPSKDAVQLGQLPQRRRLRHVVVLEATWQGARSLLSLPQVAALPRLALPASARSAFWRYKTRGVPGSGVATVEAIRLLCCEAHAGQGAGERGEEAHAGQGAGERGGAQQEGLCEANGVAWREDAGREVACGGGTESCADEQAGQRNGDAQKEGRCEGGSAKECCKSCAKVGGWGNCMREMCAGRQCHCFDDLLWLFAYLHEKINEYG